MKNIFFGLLATLLFCNLTSAQLMSDEEHRIMMNNFTIEVNDILTYNCPQGITVDQYKRGIVDGSYTLSQTMQNILIINYTQPLKDYGSQFAAAKGLTANTDALKYFYSTFAPSTVVQNGKLVESSTAAGLTATEMWMCALDTFGTSDCGSSVMVSDKSNLSTLATTSVNKLTAVAGNIGVLVMLNGFGDCMEVIPIANYINTMITFIENNKSIIENNRAFLSQATDEEHAFSLMRQLNIPTFNIIESLRPRYLANMQRINNFAALEPFVFNYDNVLVPRIHYNLLTRLNTSTVQLVQENDPCNKLTIKSSYVLFETGCFHYISKLCDCHNNCTYQSLDVATQYLHPKICPPIGQAYARSKTTQSP